VDSDQQEATKDRLKLCAMAEKKTHGREVVTRQRYLQKSVPRQRKQQARQRIVQFCAAAGQQLRVRVGLGKRGSVLVDFVPRQDKELDSDFSKDNHGKKNWNFCAMAGTLVGLGLKPKTNSNSNYFWDFFCIDSEQNTKP
jgi:hypothetical protein